jgi:hypothetical protein
MSETKMAVVSEGTRAYDVSRSGLRIDQGGKGVTWLCSCSSWAKYERCFHTRLVMAAREGFATSNLVVTLTPAARKFFSTPLVKVNEARHG